MGNGSPSFYHLSHCLPCLFTSNWILHSIIMQLIPTCRASLASVLLNHSFTLSLSSLGWVSPLPRKQCQWIFIKGMVILFTRLLWPLVVEWVPQFTYLLYSFVSLVESFGGITMIILKVYCLHIFLVFLHCSWPMMCSAPSPLLHKYSSFFNEQESVIPNQCYSASTG